MRNNIGPTANGSDRSAERARSSVFEKHEKAWALVIGLIIVGSIDLGAGILHRIAYGVPWADRARMITQARDRELREPSPIFHHGFRANRSVKDAHWGNRVYEVTTDSLGFKNRSRKTVSLTSEKHRLLFMGDSFTEGIGVEYPNTFVGIVERTLAPQGIEVLNAAVSSYSPIIYWRKIKYLLEDVGLRFDEVIVYIDITDAYDEARHYELAKDGNVVGRATPQTLSPEPTPFTSSLRNAARNNTVLLYSIYIAFKHAMPLLLSGEQRGDMDYLMWEPNRWTIDQKLFGDWGSVGLKSMTVYMEKLLALLREKEIRLTVAVYPHPHQIIHDDLNSIQVTHWKSWCEKNRVYFIDHFPSFFEPGKEAKETIRRNFIHGDVHWNEAGHRLIAETFLAHRKQQRR